VGKPVGSDLLEGKITLPVRFALDALSEKERKVWTQKISEQAITPKDVSELADFIKAEGILERARMIACNFAERALTELKLVMSENLHSLKTLSLLETVIRFIVQRRF
ncbi:MAG: polyprenyl synthetase family protein, partial [Armatimonadetes bacterium]|nr:polyprenyl synthetase family protein [Armatimonadota bacterium]